MQHARTQRKRQQKFVQTLANAMRGLDAQNSNSSVQMLAALQMPDNNSKNLGQELSKCSMLRCTSRQKQNTLFAVATAPDQGATKLRHTAAAWTGPPEFLGVSLAYELSQFCASSSAGM